MSKRRPNQSMNRMFPPIMIVTSKIWIIETGKVENTKYDCHKVIVNYKIL